MRAAKKSYLQGSSLFSVILILPQILSKKKKKKNPTTNMKKLMWVSDCLNFQVVVQ